MAKGKKLAQIAKELRTRGVGNELSGDLSGEICKEWEWDAFEVNADVTEKTVRAWEKGTEPSRRKVLQVKTSLEATPGRPNGPPLMAWERALLEQFWQVFEEPLHDFEGNDSPEGSGEKPDGNIARVRRALARIQPELEGFSERIVKRTIRALSNMGRDWERLEILYLSDIVTEREELLRPLAFDAHSLREYSNYPSLSYAGQIASNKLRGTYRTSKDNSGHIDRALEAALGDIRTINSTNKSGLDERVRELLEDAESYFSECLESEKVDWRYIAEILAGIYHSLSCRWEGEFFDVLAFFGTQTRNAPEGVIFVDSLSADDPDSRQFGPEMVTVMSENEAEMGTPSSDVEDLEPNEDFQKREQPCIKVRINKPFALGRFAVSIDEFSLFCRDAGRQSPSFRPEFNRHMPAVDITWHDAHDYCNWLSEKTREAYRLPSEAEWEFACRSVAVAKFPFHSGKRITTRDANFNESNRNGPIEASSRIYPPNAFGFYQMHGNVWEWCADDYESGYDNPRTQAPYESGLGDGRKILRGGCWDDPEHLLRSSCRMDTTADVAEEIIGFRVARDLVSW